MGSFIAKQPNGLYCRFSSVTDCPTHWNMTRDEYLIMKTDESIEVAKREADEIFEHHIKPFDVVIESYVAENGNMSSEEFEEFLKDVNDKAYGMSTVDDARSVTKPKCDKVITVEFYEDKLPDDFLNFVMKHNLKFCIV